VEFGSLHVTACDREAVRPNDTNRERAVVESGPFAEHQPRNPRFFSKRQGPARRIDHQHPRVVGIEIVAQHNLPVWTGKARGRLFCQVQVVSACCAFNELLIAKLRLSTRESNQTRYLGDRIIGKSRISGDGLSDLFGTQRRAKHFAPLGGA
jgi:hypothetical protein